MKKIFKLILLLIVTILSFSTVKVKAAQKMVCIYNKVEYTYTEPVTGNKKKGTSDAIMLEQDENGNIKIYKNSTTEINESWREISDAPNTIYKKVYDTESYVNKEFTSCPSRMSYSQSIASNNSVGGRGSNDYTVTNTITFSDETPSNISIDKQGYIYKELFDSNLDENSQNIDELTCFYEASWFESATMLSQTSDGNITVFRRRKVAQGDIDWVDSHQELDFYGTQKCGVTRTDGSHYLSCCPAYVSFKLFNSNTIFLNDNKTAGNDNSRVDTFDENWFDLKDKFLNGIIIDPTIPDTESFTCGLLLGDPSVSTTPAYYLSIAFNVIKYIAIILLIVLSVIDFISAIASQDNDIINKTVKKTITRVILCAVIFILPFLINFALKILNDYQENVGLCGIGTTNNLGGGK